MRKEIEAIKKTGKVRFVGFTTHDGCQCRSAQGRGRREASSTRSCCLTPPGWPRTPP